MGADFGTFPAAGAFSRVVGQRRDATQVAVFLHLLSPHNALIRVTAKKMIPREAEAMIPGMAYRISLSTPESEV